MTIRNINQRITDLSPAQRIALESALLQKHVPSQKKTIHFQTKKAESGTALVCTAAAVVPGSVGAE
jgi:hypothetical protein